MAKKNKRRADGLIATTVTWSDVNGSQKKTLYAKTYSELQEKETDLRRKLGLKIDVSAEKDTFLSWRERWLKLKKFETSPTWYNSLSSTAKHVDPLNNLLISEIKLADIQALIYELANPNDKSREPLAQKTLKNIRSIISQIFQLAIDSRVLEYNPALSVKIPKIASTIERRALTDTERQWIIDTPHRCQLAAMIMMFSGLRRGELIPLTWSDVNLEDKTITVNKSVQMIKGQSVVKVGGKTDCATRVVFIPDILVEFLKHTPRQGINVCLSASGEMLSETAFKRMWDSYMGELNRKYGDFSNYINPDDMPTSKYAPKKVPMVIPPITAHWLRHTFATMLYLAGVDVLTARDQLGHSDIKTTLNIYTHLDKIYKIKSVNKLNDFLVASGGR